MAASVKNGGVCNRADVKKRGSSEPWRSKRVQRLAELEAAYQLGRVDNEHRIQKPNDILVACSMAPDFFLGRWIDSTGNSICVYSADAFEVRLVATISRSSRPDLHLNLVPHEDGWHCGEARLNVAKSSPRKVCWEFPRGKESFWTRGQEDSEPREPTRCQQPHVSPLKNPRPYAAVQSSRTVQPAQALVALPLQPLWTQSQGQPGLALAALSASQASRTLAAPSAQGLMLQFPQQQAQWPSLVGRPPLRMWFA